MTSKVSIIIPTFNRLPFLKETLLNVSKQTAAPYEIIVVDDHSTDGTFQFLRRNYNTSLIAVLNDGKGPGSARNKGLEIATGNYIKFFDSDDLMSSNTLEVHEKVLSSCESGFLYSPYVRAMRHEDGEWLPTEKVILNYHPIDHRQTLNYWMVRGLFLAVPGMLFRRDLLRDVGPWPETTIAYEDWEYLWRIGLVEPYPAHSNETVLLYRQHGTQTTQNNTDDLQRDKQAVTVYENIMDFAFSKYSVSTWERLLMKSKIFKIAKMHGNEPFFSQRLTRYNSPLYNSILFFLRVENKVQRLKTRSNWSSFYGPETCDKIIGDSISKFNNE